MTAAEMAQLHARCFVVPRPWTEMEFAAFARDPHCFFLRDPHGFALGRLMVDEAELLTFAVAPERRRGGIGRRLFEGFEAEAVKRGAQRAFLEVASGNTAAISLYRNAGYTEVGRRPGYYAGQDALILSKSF